MLRLASACVLPSQPKRARCCSRPSRPCLHSCLCSSAVVPFWNLFAAAFSLRDYGLCTACRRTAAATKIATAPQHLRQLILLRETLHQRFVFHLLHRRPPPSSRSSAGSINRRIRCSSCSFSLSRNVSLPFRSTTEASWTLLKKVYRTQWISDFWRFAVFLRLCFRLIC